MPDWAGAIDLVQDLIAGSGILRIEFVPQFLIECVIQIILDHLSAQVGAAAFVPQDIAQTRTVLHDPFPVEKTGIAARAQNTGYPFGCSAEGKRSAHQVMGHLHGGSGKRPGSALHHAPVVRSAAARTAQKYTASTLAFFSAGTRSWAITPPIPASRK